MALNGPQPDGPIPGENYTSNTKNYPWHRAPDITDLDEGIEASLKQLTSKDSAYGLITMLQAGVTVVQATDIFLTSGIGKGKWTVDTALLLAGPVAHMIKILAETSDLDYNMGLEDDHFSTISFVKAKAVDESTVLEAIDAVDLAGDEIKEQAAGQTPPEPGMTEEPAPSPEMGGGFMAPPQEQGMM